MSNTMVQLDMSDLVGDFEGKIARAEQMVSFARQIRRLGKVLSAAGREIEEEYPEDFRTVGLDPTDIAGGVKDYGAAVLAATEIDYDVIEEKAGVLRALVAVTANEKTKARIELRMRALALLGRWKKLVEAKELEAKANYDLPFPVKVMNAGSEAITGERSGVTYWHNLRAVWVRETGRRLSMDENDVWLEAKRRLSEGEGEVTISDWTFVRLT